MFLLAGPGALDEEHMWHGPEVARIFGQHVVQFQAGDHVGVLAVQKAGRPAFLRSGGDDGCAVLQDLLTPVFPDGARKRLH